MAKFVRISNRTRVGTRTRRIMNTQDICNELRSKIDGNDQFFHGCRILKAYRANRRPPGWTNDFWQQLLLRQFPKMDDDPIQHYRASLWAFIIVMYFEINMPASEIAANLSERKTIGWSRYWFHSQRYGRPISTGYVKRVVQQIRFLIAGLRTDGKVPTGRPKGRPKTHPPKKLAEQNEAFSRAIGVE